MEDFVLQSLFDDIPHVQADPCERISELCTEIDEMRTRQNERFWQVIRTPVTPASITSSVISLLAWLQVIQRETAAVVAFGSVALAACKIRTYLLEREDLCQAQKIAKTQVKMLLPHVCERDMLLVRTELEKVPELRDECSDW